MKIPQFTQIFKKNGAIGLLLLYSVVLTLLVVIFLTNREEPLVVTSKNREAASLAFVGGKAASLFHLEQVEGINVPEWFCISTRMYKEFLEENGINGKISELDALSLELEEAIDQEKPPLEKRLFTLSRNIQEAICGGTMSSLHTQAIFEQYQNIGQSQLAVRSSGVVEDSPDASFAGIYDTFLNQKEFEDVVLSVKKCWASVFNERAVFERNQKKLQTSNSFIAVIVQKMITPKAAGCAFDMEISTGYNGIEIAANFGLGESVVDGEVSVDKWLLHPKTLRVIKAVLGTKSMKVVPNKTNSGVDLVKCKPGERESYSLDREALLAIAKGVQTIAHQYKKKFLYEHIDTEFAVDMSGKLYFLQARPLVSVAADDLLVVDKEDAKEPRVIAKGRFSVPGVATGRAKIIHSWEDLAEGKIVVEPEDIAITRVSTNCWSQYMTKFKGMITQEGSPTSHPILLCRERKVPCVIGLSEEAFINLQQLDGKLISIDGLNQVIYEGSIKTKKATPEDIQSRFEIPKIEAYPTLLQLGLLLTEVENGQTVYWRKKPSYRIEKILQEINLIAYDKRSTLVGAQYPKDVKLLHGYMVERDKSDEEKRKLLSHMDLAECQEFIRKQELAIEEYASLCNNFTLCAANWQRYIDLASTLRCYVLLGFSFRDYAFHKVCEEADRLQIPQHYIEAYSEQLQSQMVELDTAMVHDILRLAQKVSPIAYNISLKTLPDNLFRELEALARKYRFQKDMSFTPDLDLESVLRQVLIESEKQGSAAIGDIKIGDNPISLSDVHYFPEDDALRQWIYLAVKSRTLQSDLHHLMAEGQWFVRDALLELGKQLVLKGTLNQEKEVFDLHLEDIMKYLLHTVQINPCKNQ